MELKRDAFKAYDIRGKYPDELNESDTDLLDALEDQIKHDQL